MLSTRFTERFGNPIAKPSTRRVVLQVNGNFGAAGDWTEPDRSRADDVGVFQ